MAKFLVMFSIILSISLVLTVLLYYLRRRLVHSDRAVEKIHPAVFSFFTTIYAFFLGFAIVTLWSAYLSAQGSIAREADSLLTAFRVSQNLPDSEAFRRTLADYVNSVVEDEWPAMERDDAMSQKTDQAWDRVWQAYLPLKPQHKLDNDLYLEIANRLTRASQSRLSRSLATQSNLYPPVWVIIIFGFITALYGLYFHHVQQNAANLIFDFMVIFVLLCCIYFIYDIDTPFSGYVMVRPDTFKLIHAKMITLL